MWHRQDGEAVGAELPGKRARPVLRGPRRGDAPRLTRRGQFTALRYSAFDGTGHASQQQASKIRRYVIWRNNHAYDQRLRRIVDRASVA
jgi:hypothetical protein